ncbi:unnamed protein product [Linum trigynum]|uniref:Uncharacterized protein n=1 Tax=Linum trigynum TaxID=586398 RepID=A0AAV2FGP7_9ROSI
MTLPLASLGGRADSHLRRPPYPGSHRRSGTPSLFMSTFPLPVPVAAPPRRRPTRNSESFFASANRKRQLQDIWDLWIRG